MISVANKNVIVLGAATRSNMGQVIAERFIDEGARVIVAGRHDGMLEEFAHRTGCGWCHCDITSGEDLATLVRTTIERLGSIDVAVNASAGNVLKPFLETTHEDLEYITATNFIGPYRFFQQLVRSMPDGGSIIQISSAVATIMLDDHAAYMGTKAGLDHALRAIANEFGAQGIRANIIAPGLTDTPMAALVFETATLVEAYRREYPLGRLGTADDVAEAALFLASDGCFMTGQTLQVNGGLTLRRNPNKAELREALEK